MSRLSFIPWGACMLLAACEAQTPPTLDAPPGGGPLSAPLVGARGAIDHGELPIGSTLHAAMNRAASQHNVHFTLERSAKVELGAGCPVPVTTCLFGEQFSDVRDNSELELSADEWITSVDQLADEVEEQQLVLAVQQSSHTDVTTPAEALERVDQNEVRRIWIRHPATGRDFVVYEYGAGDNSYGAFFPQEEAQVAASIHDGDLLDCRVTSQP